MTWWLLPRWSRMAEGRLLDCAMKNVLPVLADLPAISEGGLVVPGPLDIDVWYHHHDASMTAERTQALLALLSPDEHEHLARLHNEHRRWRFMMGRALCRRVLSRYGPVPPEDWRFGLGNRGKPSIISPVLSRPLWFSLSHTEGLSACAVTAAGPEIGMDLERTASGWEALEIVAQFFPEAEANALRCLPPARRSEAFVWLWALKESFVKAREISIADGLSGTIFDLAHLDDIRVAYAESLRERAEQWRFRLFRLENAVVLALALRTNATGPLRLHAQKVRSIT
jgi:4'-phosphopantetheinyl transferase